MLPFQLIVLSLGTMSVLFNLVVVWRHLGDADSFAKVRSLRIEFISVLISIHNCRGTTCLTNEPTLLKPNGVLGMSSMNLQRQHGTIAHG
jgi:hypothetical protein